VEYLTTQYPLPHEFPELVKNLGLSTHVCQWNIRTIPVRRALPFTNQEYIPLLSFELRGLAPWPQCRAEAGSRRQQAGPLGPAFEVVSLKPSPPQRSDRRRLISRRIHPVGYGQGALSPPAMDHTWGLGLCFGVAGLWPKPESRKATVDALFVNRVQRLPTENSQACAITTLVPSTPLSRFREYIVLFPFHYSYT
jgi:hypothetical protein